MSSKTKHKNTTTKKSVTAPASKKLDVFATTQTQILGTAPAIVMSQKLDSSSSQGQGIALAARVVLSKKSTVIKQPWDYERVQYKPHKPRRIRLELPGLDHFGKELEFRAIASNRVLVRLERLMGSNRVRITDPKYMVTLLNQLESSEQKEWVHRSALRKQKEANRARRLAIEGIMEPTPDMKSLADHPVYRVNQILNRIQKMDLEYTHHDLVDNGKLPSIKSVEPFIEQKKTGLLFGFHPEHYRKTAPPPTTAITEVYEKPPEVHAKHPSVNAAGEVILIESESQVGFSRSTDFELDNLEGGEEEYYGMSQRNMVSAVMSNPELEDIKGHYGISVSEELDAIWKLHESPLIQMLNATVKDGSAVDMYSFGKEMTETCKRELKVAENFCNKVHRQLFLN